MEPVSTQNQPSFAKAMEGILRSSLCERRRMEAGGFEPPSRDISGQASTCVVGHLRFARMAAERQAAIVATFAWFRRPAANTQGRYPTVVVLARPMGGGPAGRAAI